MGHVINHGKEYQLLQQRLSQKVQGASSSPVLMKILSMLFSPEEAQIAGRLPHNFTPLDSLVGKFNIPKDELENKLTEMSQRGVLMDIKHNGTRYFTLPPVVIGLFEFVFMRTRPDMPLPDLARLFDQYFHENNDFMIAHFEGNTQLFRTFVREEALSQTDYAEILDWERASHVVDSASAWAVGLCQCHHTAEHLGTNCDRPKEVCLTFNYAAEALSNAGHARAITKKESMNILAKSKESGLVQTGDNVKNKVTFICNCCGCCCSVMRALKSLDLNKPLVSSNWIMEVDIAKCKGCGECAKVCPMNAVHLEKESEGNKKKRWAVRQEELCLGCGVCKTVCKTGAAKMMSRPQKVFVPDTVFDQRVKMAIERGKLADLIFDDPEKMGHRVLGRIMRSLESSPPFKAAMAIEPLQSVFLNTIVKGARKGAGPLADILT